MAGKVLAHMQEHMDVVLHDDLCWYMDFGSGGGEVFYVFSDQFPQWGKDDQMGAAFGG